MARVSFATAEGWTQGQEAIIDTGGPVSFVPRSIWEGLQVHYQLLSDKEFDLPIAGQPTRGKMARIRLRFLDEASVSPPLTIKLYLLPDDAHPLVLGLEDVLTEIGLYSHYPSQTAYVEFGNQVG
jgi:hypothetical protein